MGIGTCMDGQVTFPTQLPHNALCLFKGKTNNKCIYVNASVYFSVNGPTNLAYTIDC